MSCVQETITGELCARDNYRYCELCARQLQVLRAVCKKTITGMVSCVQDNYRYGELCARDNYRYGEL